MEILKDLKQDLQVHTLYLLPSHKDFCDDPHWMAGKVLLTVEEVARWRENFIRFELWKKTADGKIQLVREQLGLGFGGTTDLSVSDHLTLTTQILSQISEEGACWYQNNMVATTQALKMKFLKQVQESLHEFITESAKVPSETVVAWNHVSLDCLKTFEKEVQK